MRARTLLCPTSDAFNPTIFAKRLAIPNKSFRAFEVLTAFFRVLQAKSVTLRKGKGKRLDTATNIVKLLCSFYFV